MGKRLLHLLTGIAMLAVLFIVTSFYQVLAYKWMPPVITNKMAADFIFEHPHRLSYQWIQREKINDNLAIAVIGSEDQKFKDHFGLDLESIREALDKNSKKDRVRGASTITQQVAKNLFLWSGKNYFRKGVEAYYAILIECLWSKERILEVYLNIAQFGTTVFGAEAAAQFHFNRPAQKLTADQAALLAAVLPNPIKYVASKPSPYIIRRKQWIRQQVNQLGGFGYLEGI